VGNHELWLERADLASGDRSSLDKLLTVLELCDRLEVRTRPTVLRPVDPCTGDVALDGGAFDGGGDRRRNGVRGGGGFRTG
jgi:hypothetical protein